MLERINETNWVEEEEEEEEDDDVEGFIFKLIIISHLIFSSLYFCRPIMHWERNSSEQQTLNNLWPQSFQRT